MTESLFTPPILRLSSEALSLIFHSLPPPSEQLHHRPYADLLSICRVCKTFRKVAQPMIYTSIYLRDETTEKLASSDAFHRYFVKELTIEKRRPGHGDKQTRAKDLIRSVGKQGLQSLTLDGIFGYVLQDFHLSAASVALAGADLKSLVLRAGLYGEPPVTGFPFQLVHLGVCCNTISPPLLSSLLDSPSLSSLDLSLWGPEPRYQLAPNIFYSLPEFPSIAAKLTHFKLERVLKSHLSGLSLFTSLTHLSFGVHSTLEHIFDLIITLPSDRGATVTHLALSMNDYDFKIKSNRSKWKRIMSCDGMEALESITWIVVPPRATVSTNVSQAGGRPEVKMEWRLA